MKIELTSKMISLPERKRFSHKGDYGRVLLMCGSEKYTGAPYFAAKGAVNTGSGLVFLSVPEKIRPILSAKLNEPIIIDRKVKNFRADAALIGCGLGLSKKTAKLVREQIFLPDCALVVDADAITEIANQKLKIEESIRELVLTPHEGEFRRLVPEYDPIRREEFASNFAKENRCTLVLKGHRTLIAAPRELYVNTTGNPGMAKGGSGDVLAGIITSLIGQGIPPSVAAYTGVWLHGAAGDLAKEKFGEYSLTPTDMLGTLKTVIKRVSENS